MTRTMPLRSCTISWRVFGKIEFCETGNFVGDDAHDDGATAALAENIDAKPGDACDAVGKIGGAVLFEFADGRFVFAHDVFRDGESVLRAEALEAFVFQFDELAVDFNLGSATGRKNQIADLAVGLDHGGDELGGLDGALNGGRCRWLCRGLCGRRCGCRCRYLVDSASESEFP